MGNIGSHVDLTSSWGGASSESTGALRMGRIHRHLSRLLATQILAVAGFAGAKDFANRNRVPLSTRQFAHSARWRLRGVSLEGSRLARNHAEIQEISFFAAYHPEQQLSQGDCSVEVPVGILLRPPVGPCALKVSRTFQLQIPGRSLDRSSFNHPPCDRIAARK
jgi:hypothetical protein